MCAGAFAVVEAVHGRVIVRIYARSNGLNVYTQEPEYDAGNALFVHPAFQRSGLSAGSLMSVLHLDAELHFNTIATAVIVTQAQKEVLSNEYSVDIHIENEDHGHNPQIYSQRDCQASETVAKHASVVIAACLAVMGSCWDLGKRAKTARSIVIFLCSIANFAFKVSWNKLLTILKDMRKSSALNI
ncbi:hypothetical protein BDN70DRAFT_921362 [Pholiota conissans]|uniref:Uncharacterized protein n=1 Tax=Pholiota conissans TaxID=109636 RepID=A0A9P6CTC8_9AGAR|nr:hypothetical protein BDN70DRAFT_921362 [Pholiota conissans]